MEKIDNKQIFILKKNLLNNYKIIREKSGNSKKYLLFDLDSDLAQKNDLSKKYPEKLQKMIKRYREITGDDLGEVEELILE